MDLIPLEEDSQEDADPTAISMSPTAMQLANISTVVVGGSEPVKTIRLNGKVQPDERLVVSQSSHIPGVLKNWQSTLQVNYINKRQTHCICLFTPAGNSQEELLEAAKIRESQPQLYQAALSKLRNWKLSEQQIEEILHREIPVQPSIY
jgi:membrane fusion protein, copper/silver efflux system